VPDVQPDWKADTLERARGYHAGVDYDDARRRYEAGETTVEIARAYSVSATAIANGLKRRGVRLTPHWEREPYHKGLQAFNATKKARTHCKHGHEYTPENTWIDGRGSRNCRECMREKNRQWKLANPTKRSPRIKQPLEPREVSCPDCGAKRMVKGLPAKRCRSCARIASIGKGEWRICPCGTSFYAPRRSTGKLAQFCTIGCRVTYGGYKEMGRKLSLERGGDGNPAYKHGRRVDIQIPGWRLSRKGETNCRNCGKPKSRQPLQLHHAVPRSKARHVKADLRNGIPLCLDCHSGWHRKTVVIYRDVFTADEWGFISSVQLTGELIGPWLDRHYPERQEVVTA
jgi:hypothetical protein